MPQYPQIVLFSRGLPSELTNQRFRPARRMAGGFDVNPEPLNLEPVNGYPLTKRTKAVAKGFRFSWNNGNSSATKALSHEGKT